LRPLEHKAASASARAGGLGAWLNLRWRQLASGLCFVLFGAGALVLGGLAPPVLRLFVRDPERRQRRMRALIRGGMRFFWGCMRAVGVLTSTVRGAEHLNHPRLVVVANHPTLIDAVLLLGLIEDAVCIAKEALGRNVFVGPALRAAGYIINDDGNAMAEAARASLLGGSRLLVFPESTRTRPGAPVRFQRGAAQIAVRAESRVATVTIRVSQPFLHKGTSWHDMPPAVPHFDVEVLPPIEVAPIVSASRSPALAARELNQRMQQSYETLGRELSASGNA
jgi:1-acyl-sn-glycerol-3-phosphate acyltransferase